jgi:hypothetical protein
MKRQQPLVAAVLCVMVAASKAEELAMTKKIPAFVMWLVLAVAAVAIPLACSSSNDATDGATEKAAVDMTSAG